MPRGIYIHKPFSEKHIKNLIKNHKGMSGKHQSEKQKQKISLMFKGKHLSADLKKKLSLVKKGKPSNFKGGHFSEKSKQKARISAIHRMVFGKHKFKDTSIEILIEQELIRNRIPYMKQVPIEGVALVDFLLPNKIIVQCDGNFWHKSEWAKKHGNVNRDINQDTILGFKGYKIYRFTETEIKKSAMKCLEKVLNYE